MSVETEPHQERQSAVTLIAIVVVVMAVVVASSWFTNSTGEPGRLSDDTVVAELGTAQAPYPQALQDAVRAARTRPEDRQAAVAAARAYIDHGRRIGDARMVGAALGVLAPWLRSAPQPDVLVPAAIALQYNHDFDGAIAHLDQSLAMAPGDVEALMVRADIDVVQGRLADAAQICSRVAAAGRIELALICAATAQGLTSKGEVAYQRLEATTGLANLMTPELRTYATALLGDIALARGWRDKARSALQAALAGDPADLRTLMAYADLQLGDGDASGALSTLADAPPTDGIQLRRALAYRALGDADQLTPLIDTLQRNFDLQEALGLVTHARERARFELHLMDNPGAALEAARANWSVQREFEDAQLFLDAVEAAGQPHAARTVLDWMSTEDVDAPGLRMPAALTDVRP